MLLRTSSTSGLAYLLSSQEAAREADLDCDIHLSCRALGRTISGQNSFSPGNRNLAYRSFEEHVGGGWEVRREVDLESMVRRVRSEGDLASLCKSFACKSAANSLIKQSIENDGDLGKNESAVHRQWYRRLRHGSRSGSSDKCRGSEMQDPIEEENDERTLEAESLLDAEDVTLPSIPFRDDALFYECNAETSRDFHSYEPKVVAAESAISGRGLENSRMQDVQADTSFATAVYGSPVVCTAKGCRPVTDSEKLRTMYVASGGFGGGAFTNNVGFGGNGADPNNMESYYQKLLVDDPSNPLVLRNFAQFLYEVKHDKERAEEYFERAILAAPSDGDVLSRYAQLVWDVHKDCERAESYYKQAVEVAPDDSYVCGSYASFLWDTEENEQSDPSTSFHQDNGQLHPTIPEQTLIASA